MKRRAEFLVEKRDGRREWLRATKLARSIHLALAAVGAGEAWRAVDLAETVLAGVRKRSLLRGDTESLTTIEIADAVQQVLIATGFPGAAWAFTKVGAERRRRGALLGLGEVPGLGEDRFGGGVPVGGLSPGGALPEGFFPMVPRLPKAELPKLDPLPPLPAKGEVPDADPSRRF